MGKWNISIIEADSIKKFWEFKSLEYNCCIEDAKIMVRNRILTELFNSNKLQEKIKGMCWRNHISQDTKINEDVLQQTFLEMSKVNINELFISYCDDPNRVLALSVTITKLSGFSNLNNDKHPNRSIAKKILFASNLNHYDHISTTEDMILYRDEKMNIKEIFLAELPEQWKETDIFKLIKSNLNDEDNEFLKFLLNNVFNKKYKERYSRKLKKYYSYNEYRIKRLYIQNKIREILEKNKNKL